MSFFKEKYGFVKRKINEFSKRKDRLSYLVKKEQGIKSRKRVFVELLKAPFWIPSKISACKIGLISILLFAISKIGLESPYKNVFVLEHLNKYNISEINESSYQSMIAITSGICAIIIGLSFFVAQGLLDREDKDRARVLLYRSYFYPLLASIILLFVLLVTRNLNSSIYFIVIGIALFTLTALYRTFKILIKENELEKAKRKAFLIFFKIA